jgi:hypothetical protein
MSIEVLDPREADCRRCPHARRVEGEAHRISCAHPATASIAGSLEATIAKAIGNTGPIGLSTLQVRADPTGFTRGEFMWPSRFDPRWLTSCEGCPKPRAAQEPDGEPSQRVGPHIHIH